MADRQIDREGDERDDDPRDGERLGNALLAKCQQLLVRGFRLLYEEHMAAARLTGNNLSGADANSARRGQRATRNRVQRQ